MFRVDYSGQEAYRRGGRPYTDIICHGIAQAHPPKPLKLFARVDTGADYLVLPMRAAPRLGINLNRYSAGSVVTAAGIGTAVIVPGFDVELQKFRITTEVRFMHLHHPLVGLTALLAAFEFGFNTSAWLFL
jgi:predicted aspartyl protease